ncbi:hypothetical protein LCGC14_1514720 [marine sediment metagenome]|uniref:Uncharacterized protein n=1 Tax=marine sediment metagenome TaxID=412755 RepID=A0A0F9JL30_9ZZZZ
MTSNKESIQMGKKKPYGKIALTVMLILMFVFVGTASALEQEFNPGFEDKKGTLGVDTKSWRAGWINSTFMEGPTSDAFHTVLSATDPTAINRILLPDESGTVLTTGGLTGVIPLSDTKIFIGNSAGLGIEQAIGTGHALTNAGAMTHIANTVSSTDILNSTIAATDMAANSIGTAAANINTVTLAVAAGVLFNTVEVETGSTFLGWRTGTEGVLANTSVFVNTVSYTDPDFRVSYSDEQADLPASTIIGTFLRP